MRRDTLWEFSDEIHCGNSAAWWLHLLIGPGLSFAKFVSRFGWVRLSPAFFSRFGRSGARTKKTNFRETCAFRFAWRIHGSRCCTPRRSVVQRRYDAYNRLQGVSRCLNAQPGAPRDSAPAAVYVVFGPALKKLWKQKFKLVMALAHKSLRLESFAKFGGGGAKEKNEIFPILCER